MILKESIRYDDPLLKLFRGNKKILVQDIHDEADSFRFWAGFLLKLGASEEEIEKIFSNVVSADQVAEYIYNTYGDTPVYQAQFAESIELSENEHLFDDDNEAAVVLVVYEDENERYEYASDYQAEAHYAELEQMHKQELESAGILGFILFERNEDHKFVVVDRFIGDPIDEGIIETSISDFLDNNNEGELSLKGQIAKEPRPDPLDGDIDESLNEDFSEKDIKIGAKFNNIAREIEVKNIEDNKVTIELARNEFSISNGYETNRSNYKTTIDQLVHYLNDNKYWLNESLKEDNTSNNLNEYIVKYEQYERFSSGGFRQSTFKAKSDIAAIIKVEDKCGYGYLKDMKESPEDYEPDELEALSDKSKALDVLLKSNGDGADYIFFFKNLTTGEVFIDEDYDENSWDDDFDESKKQSEKVIKEDDEADYFNGDDTSSDNDEVTDHLYGVAAWFNLKGQYDIYYFDKEERARSFAEEWKAIYDQECANYDEYLKQGMSEMEIGDKLTDLQQALCNKYSDCSYEDGCWGKDFKEIDGVDYYDNIEIVDYVDYGY